MVGIHKVWAPIPGAIDTHYHLKETKVMSKLLPLTALSCGGGKSIQE
jgi:hypothetical protein